MRIDIRGWIRPALFTLGGAGAGLLYYHFFGCTSGCPITSSPIRSMVYLALVGWLLSSIIDRVKED